MQVQMREVSDQCAKEVAPESNARREAKREPGPAPASRDDLEAMLLF